MSTAGGRAGADATMGALARVLVRVFFRRVEVTGADLPDGPVVVVANHTNGLVDGLLLMATLRRYPRFLGKDTLFRILPLRPFLHLAGVVAVHRASDRDPSPADNDRAFEQCRRLLADRGLMAVFPEGISHDEAALQPLRTGAARIALGAAFDDGTAGIVVVPVGLVYDAKARFRSRALVTVGPPIGLDRWGPDHTRDPRAAGRDLTAALDAALRAVGPDYASLGQAADLAQAAGVVTAGASDPASPLAGRDRLARRWALIGPDDPAHPDLDRLLDADARYQHHLALVGVTDADVIRAPGPGRYRMAMARSIAELIVAAPVALIGAVIHLLPYRVMKRLGRIPTNQGIRATVKLLGCTLLFVIEWLVLAVMAGLAWGAAAGLAVLVGCPLSGWVTVRFAERWHDAGGLAHGVRALRSRRGSPTDLLAERAEVIDAARRLDASRSGVPSARAAPG